MKIAVIGAGFTGLACAFELSKDGHQVTVFEKDAQPGGLAIGFEDKKWKWGLEKHYHHWFYNDNSVIGLAKEINHKVIVKRPKTSVYIGGKIYQLDSPLHVLSFPLLPIIDKLRMAFILAFLKFNPIWKPLEKIKTHEFLIKSMGGKSYEMIWEPQMLNKFGAFYKTIALSWFWARIRKRTAKLVYPEGGFLNFANHIVRECEAKGVKFQFAKEIEEIKGLKNKKVNVRWELKNEEFDKVIVTLPSFFFTKIIKNLPKKYIDNLLDLKGLGAINLVLKLKRKFLNDGTYWLSICEKNSPVMAVVEHTNFMDKKNYNNEHLVYLGNYLPQDHKYFKMSDEELLKTFTPFLKKINPQFKTSILNYKAFKVPFAQPIIPVNYSKKIPPFKTPIPNVYLANIQQVYPWDRGTNYAVELGQKVADLIQNEPL